MRVKGKLMDPFPKTNFVRKSLCENKHRVGCEKCEAGALLKIPWRCRVARRKKSINVSINFPHNHNTFFMLFTNFYVVALKK